MNKPASKTDLQHNMRVETQPGFIKPDHAPDCYGDGQKRSDIANCGTCDLAPQCGEFVDRTRLGRSHGVAGLPPESCPAIWADDAPLIGDWDNCETRPADWRESQIRLFLDEYKAEDDSGLNAFIRTPLNLAFVDRMLPFMTFVEVEVAARIFTMWLVWIGTELPPKTSARNVADLWMATEIARRMLRLQGRPLALRPERIHEAWSALFVESRSLESIGDGWRRADDLFDNHIKERTQQGA